MFAPLESLYNTKNIKILKGSLVLITFTFSENSNYGRESLLEVERQNIARLCQQTFENKKFVDITQQCFAFLPQVNFPANNLNFQWRWRWWDQIHTIFLNLFCFAYHNLNTYILFNFMALVCHGWIWLCKGDLQCYDGQKKRISFVNCLWNCPLDAMYNHLIEL